MTCKYCIYWEPIGDTEAVEKYRQERKDLPKTTFNNFVVTDNDTNFYGRCTKYESDAIKDSTSTCAFYQKNRN